MYLSDATDDQKKWYIVYQTIPAHYMCNVLIVQTSNKQK